MGISSSLFYDANDPEKQTLHRRVRPTDEQVEEQQARWNAVAEHLTADLKARSGYAIRTWLQGSYKFRTQVRPPRRGDEFDVDLGVYFQWKGQPEDGEYTPKQLKAMVQESLGSYEGDGVVEVVSPAKPRCARIRFEGDFHIDVPAYHLDPERDARTLATEPNGWEDSDPKALYLWFKNRFDDYTRDKVRRQIRYMKCWAGLKFREDGGRPSSTLLTVLVAEAIDSIASEDLASDDDMLLAVLEALVERLEDDGVVCNPVDREEDLAARLSRAERETFLEKLRRFRDVAREALASETVLAAAGRWEEAFEHFFPMPEEDAAAKADKYLPVPFILPEVAVRAVSRDNRQFKREGVNEVGPIPKNCGIYFNVTNPGALPSDAEVEWMVRNEGDEAEYTNDLGHKAGVGLKATERSAYKGTHYMDCAVRRYGRIVALRRVRVTIRGIPAPKRNPPKPSYVKLRGRR